MPPASPPGLLRAPAPPPTPARHDPAGPGRARRPGPSFPPERRVRGRVETEVLRAFQRGEEEAVRALYVAYGRLVYAVAYRVLGQRELAEDAVQQTFVKAWQASERIDVERDPAAWLATIAKRVAIDMYRRGVRRPTDALTRNAVDDPAFMVPPPDIATVDRVWHVHRALDALPKDEAMIVRLQHLDGLTHAQVAVKLGIPVGTVKSRSHRAHRKLAALLGHLRETAQ